MQAVHENRHGKYVMVVGPDIKSRNGRSSSAGDNSGKPTGEVEDFMTGFVVSDKAVWGRPVGVAVAQDGSLFVSEDGNGSIWRIAAQATRAHGPAGR